MQTKAMIATHPEAGSGVDDALIAAINAAYACAQACTSCADACVAEEMVGRLRQCIRFNLDCADVCIATAAVATRRTGADDEVLRRMLDACSTACRLCGDECDGHAGRHPHCRICAQSCRDCEYACHAALRTM